MTRAASTQGPGPARMWLDAADTIVGVDEAWLQFARANQAPELTREAIVGRPLSTFITGLEMVELTALLTAAARKRGTAIAVPFRCDSPDVRRFMTMTLQAELRGGVRFEYRLDRVEPRTEGALFDRQAPRSEDLIRVCSWCGRIRHAEAWNEVEQAIALGGYFVRGALIPKLSHGICDDCRSVLVASAGGGRPA